MSVQVETAERDHCRVELKIEVPAEEVQRAIEREKARVLKQVSVPGFRRGKAPRHLAERYIDPDLVRERAVERTALEATRRAIEEADLHPFSTQMDFDPATYAEGAPLSFTATVSLPPHVHLGEYRGLQVPYLIPKITDADVDRELEVLRNVFAVWQPKDGPVGEADRARVTIATTIEGEPVPDASVDDRWLEMGANLPELERGILGLKAGEEREHTFTYPEDAGNPAWRGKEAHARVQVHEVRQRVPAELNDELAQQLGLESAEALRERVRRNLEAQARALADSELEQALLRQAVSNSEIHLPQELVTRRVAERVAELVKALQRRGLSLEQYLQHEKITLSDLEARYQEETRRNLEAALVVREIAEAENLQVTDEEIDAALREEAQQESLDDRQTRRLLQDEEARDRQYTSVLFGKVLSYLRNEAKIEEKTA